MMLKFLGLPLFVWGGLCLVVALAFTFFWPSGKVGADTTALRYFVLRWFHALVWLLLALSCFIRGTDSVAGAGTANLVALAALPIYLVFVAVLVTS